MPSGKWATKKRRVTTEIRGLIAWRDGNRWALNKQNLPWHCQPQHTFRSPSVVCFPQLLPHVWSFLTSAHRYKSGTFQKCWGWH